jgi:hypothetical protein
VSSDNQDTARSQRSFDVPDGLELQRLIPVSEGEIPAEQQVKTPAWRASPQIVGCEMRRRSILELQLVLVLASFERTQPIRR